MAGATTRGVLYVHSAPRALCPHIEWAAGGVLGVRLSMDWIPQPAAPGMYRAELSWQAEQGTGARLTSALRGWAHLRYEVTEEPSNGVDGARWSHTPELGICQWFHYHDHRLDDAVAWMKRLGVKHLRTGLSWADSFRPNALEWFDRQMEALADFDVTVTFCFTPEHRGIAPHHTSPPQVKEEFAEFCGAMIRRYASSTRAAPELLESAV